MPISESRSETVLVLAFSRPDDFDRGDGVPFIPGTPKTHAAPRPKYAPRLWIMIVPPMSAMPKAPLSSRCRLAL